jgi:hypothetical protein
MNGKDSLILALVLIGLVLAFVIITLGIVIWNV